MRSDSQEILILFPNMHYDTPVAPNIWGKNLAKSFALSGVKPAVLYMGQRTMQRCVDSYGVEYKSLPVLSAWSMGVPKLRTLLLPMFQKRFILRSKGKYKMIIPLEGPYTLKREMQKNKWIHEAGSKYFFTILEHPKRNAAAENAGDYRMYMKKVANMYDIVLTITDYVRKIFIEYGRTKPTIVNPIIVDTKPYKNNELNGSELFIRNFLYCGNLCHEEEMGILFREFALVVKHHPYASLLIIGGGGSRKHTDVLVSKYREVCIKSKIIDSVKFLGRLPHDEVIYHYKHADAFLLPRPFREYSAAGFPTKLGEYLATGKPVIAYATGDIPKYLTHKETAYLAMDDNEGTFASLVIEAMNDRDAYSIGRNGCAIAEKSFSIEATAKRLATFFQEYTYALE